MNLQALLFCSDEKVVKVLRRVLGDLDITVEHCDDSESTIRQITRRRFESVIVDCADNCAADILKSVRSAPCNKQAIAVAMVDGQTALRGAFELGAHFVLYKPISTERAKASFRAARALMKCERRRNTRVPVQTEVVLLNQEGRVQHKLKTSDLSEGGLSLQLQRAPSGPMRLRFTLPGTDLQLECLGELAWQNPGNQAGIRFRDLSIDAHAQLKAWVTRQLEEPEPDDPPLRCKLTDLSLGGCYLEVASPFPMRTRITLSMKVGELQIRAAGVVRVVHAELGMGVEFTRNTSEQRANVEKFINALVNSNGELPDILVEPEGLETCPIEEPASARDLDDPLIDLFYNRSDLPTEDFLEELRKQRKGNAEPAPAQVG